MLYITNQEVVYKLKKGMNVEAPNIWDKIKNAPIAVGTVKQSHFSQISKVAVIAACLTVIIGTISVFNLFNDRNNPFMLEQNNSNSEKLIITGNDSVSFNKKDNAVVNENSDYKANISPLLFSEMEKYNDKDNYRVIIIGLIGNTSDFQSFKYEGKTYSEYKKMYQNAYNDWEQYGEDSSPLLSQAAEKMELYIQKMQDTANAYEVYFKDKFGDLYNYLQKSYSLISTHQPIDFDNISLEDYQMLAIAPYQTIIKLASDGFYLYLAPKENNNDNKPISSSSESVNVDKNKVSERIYRDILSSKIVNVCIEISDNEINFDELDKLALSNIGISYEQTEHDSSKKDKYLAERNLLITKKYNEIKIYLIKNYSIPNVSQENISTLLFARLTYEQIIRLSKDDNVAHICNACEINSIGGDY